MATAQLHDKRLNERLTRLLSDLGDRPTASIPAACGGYAEMMAAYRFFDNPKVTAAQILEPHYAATRQRLAAQPVVLLVQDTTEGDLTRPPQQVAGVGPLDGGTRRGVFVHPVAAFTPDGTPLGTVALPFWAREESAPDPAPPSRNRPIEEKESFRWVQGLRTARDVAQELPQTQVVCSADSDADVYEVFAELRGERPVDWLIRACRDRCVEGEADAPHQKLYESVMAQPVLFTQQITVRMRAPKLPCEKRPRRVGRVTRTATVQVRAASVTLHPPRLGVMVRLIAQLGGYVNRSKRVRPSFVGSIRSLGRQGPPKREMMRLEPRPQVLRTWGWPDPGRGRRTINLQPSPRPIGLEAATRSPTKCSRTPARPTPGICFTTTGCRGILRLEHGIFLKTGWFSAIISPVAHGRR
jgi:hypothetical protein